MSRGTMYHITADPDSLGGFGEGSLYDIFEALGADYIQDHDPCQAAKETEALHDSLKSAGFTVNMPKEQPYDGPYAFSIGPMSQESLVQAKKKYFQGYLDLLQKKVAELTIDTFIDPCELYGIKELIDDPCGDAVWLDMGTGGANYTMMRAIRELTPDTEFFVDCSTVYMH